MKNANNSESVHAWLKDESSVRLGVDDVSLLSACLMDDACATVRAVDWTCTSKSVTALLFFLFSLSRSVSAYAIFSVSFSLFTSVRLSLALSMLMSASRCSCIVDTAASAVDYISFSCSMSTLNKTTQLTCVTVKDGYCFYVIMWLLLVPNARLKLLAFL